MRDIWQVHHSQHAQPPIARCGPAGLSHWRFRVQIITLFTKIKITVFALGLQYKWYGNKSDMYSLTCCASKSFDSQSKAESSNTENFEGGLEYSLHNFPPPHTGHLPECLHLIHSIPRQVCKTTWDHSIKISNFNGDAGFYSCVCYLQVKTNPTLIWKVKGCNAFYEKILISLKTRQLIQKVLRNLIAGRAHLLSRGMLVDKR